MTGIVILTLAYYQPDGNLLLCRKAKSPDVTPVNSEAKTEEDAEAGCSKDAAAEPDSQGSLSACSPTQEMLDNSESLFE